jgi:exopolysaccharide biosynthesis polyprenyl glycosylphosphotransferase
MDSKKSPIWDRIIPFLIKWRLLNVFLGALDIFSIAFAYQLAYAINYSGEGRFFFTDPRFLFLFLGVLPFWLGILYLIQITEIPRTKQYRVLLFEYLQSAVGISMVLLVVYFFLKMNWISRLFLMESAFIGSIFLFLIRLLEYKVFKNFRASGFNHINVILIVDDSSSIFIESLIKNKEWGYKIIAIFTTSPSLKEQFGGKIIIVPEENLATLNALLEVEIIDEVLYVKSIVIPTEVRKVIRSCEELGVIFRLKYESDKLQLTNAIETRIGTYKFLNFINVPSNSYSIAIKRFMDVLVSLSMIIILAPLLLFITVVIKVTSKGPVFYNQVRVGLRGRQFKLYKFRTMVYNAEQLQRHLESVNEADGPVFKLKNDPRITSIGKFLRKSGLDELPQLFNILKGEMSLIGPRPPLPSETVKYARWQLRRLSVRPGLSCFWQIKPDRNSIKFDEWMEMDLAYIDNWSLRLDIIILVKTVRTVFLRSGL